MNWPAIIAGVFIACTVAVLIMLHMADRAPHIDEPVQPLEPLVRAAIHLGDEAMADYRRTGDPERLVDGLLDVRSRLRSGLPEGVS